MADSIRTENLKFDQYKMQLEAQQEKQLKDLRDKQRIELEKTMDHYTAVKQDIEKAYQIELSNTQDEHQQRLTDLRKANAKAQAEEKANGEAEVDKTRARYQEQIARYKENSEKMIEDVRKEADTSANNIRMRAKERSMS